MTNLHLKLNQLSLTTMSKQLDQMIANAATKNLGFARALETLADLKLDSRNGRAVERRFRVAHLHVRSRIGELRLHLNSIEPSTPSTASTLSTITAAWRRRRIVRLLDLSSHSDP